MPRRSIDPAIPVLGFFETAPLDAARLALAIASETIRRRLAGESVLTKDGPKIDLPQPKTKKRTRETPPTNDATPLGS